MRGRKFPNQQVRRNRLFVRHLFHEEPDASRLALRLDALGPPFLHHARAVAGLSADDDPIQFRKMSGLEIDFADQRLA